MKPGEASSTAKLIAAATILLASDRNTAPLVAPGAADLCRQLLSLKRSDRWLARSAAHPVTRRIWRWMEQLTHPGIVAHYWHRKRWIEQRCRRAIFVGGERLIVVGAGFDTLGYRLARELGAEVLEIDHPSTQAAKHAALGDDVLQLIALDLATHALPRAVVENRKSAVVILEGVLMYLGPEAIDRLFASLRGMAAESLTVIFSFMTRWPDGTAGFRPRSWLVERWLALRGEPFDWAIEPEALGAFLEQRGFALSELALTHELGPGSGKLDGENLAVCERVR